MRLKIHLAIAYAAVAIATSSASNVEAQSVTIRLDNAPSPAGSVPYTETPNDVCVYVKHFRWQGGLSWHQLDCRPLNTVSSTHDFCLAGDDTSNIYEVKITINGSNAFWLDKWSALPHWCGSCNCAPGAADVVNGIDNNVGYCFSTQSSDYSGPPCTAWGTAGQTGSGPSYSELWWNY